MKVRYRRNKKTFSLILALLIFINIFVSISASGFSAHALNPNADSQPIQASPWAVEELRLADQLSLIPDSIRNKLRQSLTRSEFCDIAVLFTELYFPGIYDSTINQTRKSFVDTSSDNISVASYLGIVMGVDEFRFMPDAHVSRMEVSTMLARAVRLAFTSYTPVNYEADAFLDSAEAHVLPPWALESVEMMIALDALKGDGVSSYMLDSEMTGEQAVLLAYRLYNTLSTNRTIPAFTPRQLLKISEIRDMEASVFMPVAEGSVFDRESSLVEPLEIGRPSETTILNGLKAINYARYLANLPYDLAVTDELNSEAQYGAFVMSATGQFTHSPVNDGRLPTSMFERGKNAVSSSNIGLGYRGIRGLYDFNMSCIHDSDTLNIDRLGHRRWLLNPNLQMVGMGLSGLYTATKIFDTSRDPAINPEYTSWPGAGVFPIRSNLELPTLAWSISLNKSDGDIESAAVSVTNVTSGKAWSFDQVNTSGEGMGYFNINNGIFGSGPAIIFRPEGMEINHGDEFKVSFDALTVNGRVKSGEYSVKFFF